MLKKVVIYTDGSCQGNPGPGGWAAILHHDKKNNCISGHSKQTTNNRMEMMAAIMALESLKRPMAVDLYTDSTYVRSGITEWLPGWKRRNWRTAAKKPVKNVDLWQRLDSAAAAHQIAWHWVKGHAGNPGNERADELAREGIPTVTT